MRCFAVHNSVEAVGNH